MNLDDYGASRAALVRHALSMGNLPGGPWRGHFIREGGEGALQVSGIAPIPPADAEKQDGRTTGGVGILHNANPHAPFRDFQLLDGAGNPPAAGTPAEVAQARYAFYLTHTGNAVNALRQLLPHLERLHIDGVDTEPLTGLRIALPEPPYLPLYEMTHMFAAVGNDGWTGNVTIKTDERGAPPEAWEDIVAEEAKLIDAARLQLHRMATLAQRKDWELAKVRTQTKPIIVEGAEDASPDAATPVVDESAFTVRWRNKTCSFVGNRSKLLFDLFVRLNRRPGHRVDFNTMRGVGDVWNGYEAEDETIRGAVSRLKKRLRSAKMTDLARAISTGSHRNGAFAILNLGPGATGD